MNQLNERDKQIILLLSEGKTQKEIASEMFMSRDCVRIRISKLIKKFNCTNATSLCVKIYPKVNALKI